MAILCPTCPLTEAEKHEFIFETEAAEEKGWGGWWSSSPRRNAADVAFDTVVPDTQYVDPSLKYKIAAILKTKEATKEKIIAAQICALTDRTIKKIQVDAQLIIPSMTIADKLIKVKRV